MSDQASVEIIAIGTEILLGEITDTNSVHIAKTMRDIGMNVFFMTSVGDNINRIQQVLENALGRADVVITCGGLGPTVDDMTRQGIANATGQKLVFQPTLFDQIEARFAQFNVKMTENNRRQAYLPEGAVAIENPVGTAPGFMVEHNGQYIFSLPGVPREMKYLLEQSVVPKLRELYDLGMIKVRVLKTAGIGESSLDTLIGPDLLERRNPTVGLAAHHGIIDIRLTAKASDAIQADTMLDTIQVSVMEKAGKYVFGIGDVQLEQVFNDLLRKHHKQLAVIEAGIEDAALARLTRYQTADDKPYLVKILPTPQQLAIAIDQTHADLKQLAEDAIQRMVTDSDADLGIAIVSLPDVDEGADTDHATVVSVYCDGQIRTRGYGFGGKSRLAREWSSRWGISLAWRMLKESIADVD